MEQANSRKDVPGGGGTFPAIAFIGSTATTTVTQVEHDAEERLYAGETLHDPYGMRQADVADTGTPIEIQRDGLYLITATGDRAEEGGDTPAGRWIGIKRIPVSGSPSEEWLAEAQGLSTNGIAGNRTSLSVFTIKYLYAGDVIEIWWWHYILGHLRSNVNLPNFAVALLFEFTDDLASGAGTSSGMVQANSRHDASGGGGSVSRHILHAVDTATYSLTTDTINLLIYDSGEIYDEDPGSEWTFDIGSIFYPTDGIYFIVGVARHSANATGVRRTINLSTVNFSITNGTLSYSVNPQGYNSTLATSCVGVLVIEGTAETNYGRTKIWVMDGFTAGTLDAASGVYMTLFLGDLE